MWCENGIVFLRPPQATAGVFPEGAGSLPRLLRPRSPSALSERDHLFTGRCDLVIPPLSRNFPRSLLLNSKRKSAHRRRQQPFSRKQRSCRECPRTVKVKKREKRRKKRQRDCDEVVKSVERLKIIQGSALRADALTALTCPHLSAYNVISRYLADPLEEHEVGGSTESRDLWDRISSLDTSCDEFAKVTARSKQDINRMHCRRTFSQELLILIIHIYTNYAIK